MVTDPSWLYSTIAQSSAAIVAIIGGFITASILNMLSEKRSLQKQISEKQLHIQALNKKEKGLKNIYDTNQVEYFLKRELENYSDDSLPTLDEIFSKYPSDYRNFFNKDILQKMFFNINLGKIKAKLYILKHHEKINIDDYQSFLQWAKPNVSTVEYLEICSEYDRYLEQQKEKESALKKEKVLPNWAYIALLPDKKKEEDARRSEQNNISREIKKLDDQTSFLDLELGNLNTQVSSFSYPPNLKWGIMVLGYLAGFCIFLPVYIIATEAFSTWSKNLTMYSFYFGILLIFGYIVIQIRQLRRSPNAKGSG